MQRSLSTQGVGRDRLRDDRKKVGAVPVVRVRTSCARPSPAKPRIHGDTATNSPGKPFTHSSPRAIAATMAMRAPLIQAVQAAVCSPLKPANQGGRTGYREDEADAVDGVVFGSCDALPNGDLPG